MKLEKFSSAKFLAISGILMLIALPLALPDTLHNVWLQVKTLIEERKLIILKELEKEKARIEESGKSQLLKIPKYLWERFKGLLR